MKRLFPIITILLLLTSCGSTDKKESNSGQNQEFSWIENNDFQTEKAIKYEEESDLFFGGDSDYDSLSTESIARMPDFKLEAVATSTDSIGKIAGLCYQRKFSEASQVMDALFKKYKKHPGYWNQVGTCFFLQGNMRGALLYYNKSLGFNKNYAPPINNLGVIYQREGREQKALLAFKRASELNSFSLTPIFNLSQMYLKYGFTQKARALLSALLKKNSKDVDVINSLAVSYLMESDANKALPYYEKLSRDKLSRYDIGINYAYTLKLAGKASDAKSVFNRINTAKLGDSSDYYQKVKKYLEK
ncbi:MAG: tetratricopeptide repeat protein [Bacteriovoracaceae bacterium]|nr:tetratricopeptide repeat protein [Bacteriovoracaceae bacterium]